uniref:chromosome alignment-maintaining phosphoprotein 1-like isoform X2 n=1 Tax=Solea senegalensis TaxID=28829 RepID=UPI001CD902D1|nr:chromosome alignment-maintaining phosphoprotein 1-like isoform X2 [Solea senegalensis]XP_043907906.1 chromosome alignment-maintaining phosphoprotein 1-like isoform X3 [Solea senegalensis]
MSVIIHTRGEVGGGVAAHLRCSYCGHLSKSHAHQLSHIAASHPAHLDNVAFGRLGNILIYQSTARLFHCADCFYTTRDFTKLYTHIITTHCLHERDAHKDKLGGDNEKMEDKGEEEKMEVKGKDEKMEDKGKDEKMEDKGEDLKEKADETHEEDGAPQRQQVAKPDLEARDSVLMFDGAFYHCLFCDFRNKMKVLGLNHVVKKHAVPKTYAIQAIRRSADATPRLTVSGGGDEEEALAKVVSFISNRYVCQICGWKNKLKGFVISHVGRSHSVDHPYRCTDCSCSFFLPSRLQQHVSSAHRPGRYACPFCCFRSQHLGGLRRHCSRCNAREEEELQEGGAAAGRRGEDEEGEEIEEEAEEGVEERKETRGERKRKRAARAIQEDDDDDEYD